ncbi:hypothetical protein AVEN_90671-1 [Araneus ventricosus]|uniref:Uncharacterized protein n=1 Tax=Araneus ventricosus TaxID=182803 RepID=A0A4Y2F1E6_ARAVE|nr:hypothetical protein AVEN_90671-1 [Araneus ventricosus]
MYKHRLSQDLTSDEIEKAKEYWIFIVQKQCFPAEIKALGNSMPLLRKSKIARFYPFLKENHLRLGGRLQFSAVILEVKHTLLLDGSYHFCNFLYVTLMCVCITWVSELVSENYDRIIGFYVDVKLLNELFTDSNHAGFLMRLVLPRLKLYFQRIK